MQDQKVTELKINHLQANPFQPRDHIKQEDLLELSDSISKFGILEPLVVTETPAGFQIIAGERRWRAAQQAGLTTVPVIIKKVTPREMLEMAIIENLQRVDLGAIERAQAFQQLMRSFEYSAQEVADRLSKSISYVRNTLRLLKLPDAIKDGLLGGLIDEGHARAISGIDDPHKMVQVYKQILKTNASVRQAEQLARIAKEEIGQKYQKGIQAKKSTAQTLREVAQWEKDLSYFLKIKSKIKLHQSERQTKIVITLKGDRRKTENKIAKIIAYTTGKTVDDAEDEDEQQN